MSLREYYLGGWLVADLVLMEQDVYLISHHGEVPCKLWYSLRQFDDGLFGYYLSRIEEL